MKYLCLLAAAYSAVSSAVDLPIIASLDGLSNVATATPTAGSPFSWSDAHSSCSNNNPTLDGLYGYCAASNTNADSYLQVDLGDVYDISSVGIKGWGGGSAQWVTSYNLLFSVDGVNFIEDGIDNPLTGNTDQTTEVKSVFAAAIEARYLRVNPVTFSGWKTFRFEAYGELASSECDAVDIDFLLETCSTTYEGLTAASQANADGLVLVNGRIDNLIANSAAFYNDAPDAAQSVFGNHVRDTFYSPDGSNYWFAQNKDNLLVFSLVMNFCIILFGSCICLKAGVCAKAFSGARETVRYRKVKPYSSADEDERNQIVVGK